MNRKIELSVGGYVAYVCNGLLVLLGRVFTSYGIFI